MILLTDFSSKSGSFLLKKPDPKWLYIPSCPSQYGGVLQITMMLMEITHTSFSFPHPASAQSFNRCASQNLELYFFEGLLVSPLACLDNTLHFGSDIHVILYYSKLILCSTKYANLKAQQEQMMS